MQSGQSGELMLNPLVKPLGGVPFKYFGDWTDRIAKGELPHAKPPRPQGVERNIVVTTWDWLNPKHYLHDLIASDRRYPTVNAYGPLFGSPEYSDRRHADPRSQDAHRDELQGAGARRRHAGGARPGPRRERSRWRRRLTGARRRSGTPRPTTTTACSTGRAGSGSRRRCAAPRTRLLQEGLGPSVGQAVPAGADEPPAHHARSEDDAIHLRRYLLPDASPAVRLRRQRDAVDQRRRTGGRLDQHQDVRRDRRRGKSQGWTPLVLDTNGNGKRDEYVEPDQPVDPTKDKRIVAGFYAVMPSPVDGSIWGSVGVFGGTAAVVRLVPGQSAGDRARGDLQRAEAGLRHPWRRHRQAGRRVGVAR